MINRAKMVYCSTILYTNLDNTKTSSWMTSTGLQLPVESVTTGSKDSIPKKAEKATEKRFFVI